MGSGRVWPRRGFGNDNQFARGRSSFKRELASKIKKKRLALHLE